MIIQLLNGCPWCVIRYILLGKDCNYVGYCGIKMRHTFVQRAFFGTFDDEKCRQGFQSIWQYV